MSQATDRPTTIPSRRAVLAGAPAAAAAALAAGTAINGLALANAMGAIPTSQAPASDPDAALSELVGRFIEVSPEVDAASADAWKASDAADRETMIRLGMDPDAPGARWCSKEMTKGEQDHAMSVWSKVREELGTDRAIDRQIELNQRRDAIFEEMLTLPIRTARGAIMMFVTAISVGCIGRLWDEPEEDLDWEDLAVRRIVENMHLGVTGKPLAVPQS